MAGGSSRSGNARTRIKSSNDAGENDNGVTRGTKPNLKPRSRNRSKNDQSLIRIFNVDLKIMLGIGVFSFLIVLLLIHNLVNHVEEAEMPRVITPFPAPKLMDLPQVTSIITSVFFKRK